MSFIMSVEIFSSVELYELNQICDAFKLEKYGVNEIIINQNEEGNKFYIIESGEAYAVKIIKEGII